MLATAAILVLLSSPTVADQNHTRSAFRQVMAQVVAAANEESPFASVTGRKTGDDHSGDTRYAVTVFVPIFASCEVRNDWHVPTALFCRTNPNPDGSAVRLRFDEMAADLKSVLTARHLVRANHIEIGSCDDTAIFPNGERCFTAWFPNGEVDLSVQSDTQRRRFLLMRVGNY